jgi:hypothetical protein
MTITFPVTPPSSPGYTRFDMDMETAAAIARSPFTYEQQVQEHQGQRWIIKAELPPMKREVAAAWQAFVLSLRGVRGTFLLGDPDGATPQGIATGSPSVDGASQSGFTLATKGWTAGQTGILLAGDYIQLGTGASSTLHMVMADANSDGGGLTTLDINPRLRSSPSDSATITTTNCKGVFRMRERIQGWRSDHASRFGIDFECEEAL